MMGPNKEVFENRLTAIFFFIAQPLIYIYIFIYLSRCFYICIAQGVSIHVQLIAHGVSTYIAHSSRCFYIYSS